MGTKFNNNDIIQSFKELIYFTAITSIPSNAFQEDDNLRTMKIPLNVTSLGGGCFNLCKFTYLDFIPESVNAIPTNNNITFIGCIIPSSVTSVASRAFSGNSRYRSSTYMQWIVFMPTTPPSFAGNPFYIDYSNSKIYVPDDSVAAYKAAKNLTSHASRVYPISEMATYHPDDWNTYKDRFEGLY